MRMLGCAQNPCAGVCSDCFLLAMPAALTSSIISFSLRGGLHRRRIDMRLAWLRAEPRSGVCPDMCAGGGGRAEPHTAVGGCGFT